MKSAFLLVLGVVVVSGVVPTGAGEVPVPRMSTATQQFGVFLRRILTNHFDGSVGGVCYFNFGPTASWRMVHDFPLIWGRLSFTRGGGFVVVRLCDAHLCATAARQDPASECELTVVLMEKHRDLPRHLRALSGVPFWAPMALHVFLFHGAKEADAPLTETLATFGVIRSVHVQLAASGRSGAFVVHFPILFERRVIEIAPKNASRWMVEFDQLADLHGYQYRTLYHTLIPYLYRYDGVFGGPDYSFLQTVLERQNATHQWLYHRSTDAELNSSDLHHVDRRLLERGRVSFSLNRLLAGRSDALEKLYLNTFDGTCVLVPRMRLHTFILRLWEPFSQYVWYTVLAIVLLAIVGNVALPGQFAVNYLLALLFGGKLVDYRLRALDRTVLFVLDVLLFLLKEAYTAKIITYMIQMQYEPELATMLELARAGPPLLLSPGDYEGLRERLARFPGLRIVLRDDFSSFATTWDDYFRPTFAHVVPCSYGRALVSSHAMQEPGAPQFYVLRERLRIQPEAFTFPRHQPFAAKMRFFVETLLETGIYESWLRGDYYMQERTPTLDEILRFENLSSLFYVLLFGYALSGAVFVGEQIVAKCRANVNLGRARLWCNRAKLTGRG